MDWMRYGVVALSVTIGACTTPPKSADKSPKPEPTQNQTQGSDANSQGADYSTGAAEALNPGVTNLPGNRLVYFDYDVSQLSSSARQILDQHSAYLQANPNIRVRIEGHADERGSREYNLALGEQRALAIQRYLTISGVTPSRLLTFSYGEEKPINFGHGASAWQQNRRAELVY